MLDGHGDDIYRYNDLVKMNFSSNIYQHADLTALKEFMKGHFDLIANYPEPQPRSLERLIALKEGISPEAVLVTNGATEAIYMIAAHFKNSASVIPQPTFNEYADACRQFNHIISYENNDEMTELPRDRVYWICNPNNPSGNVLMKGFMDYVVRRSPRYAFVVDQSYEGYTKEPLLQAREMIDVPNLLMLHSLSLRCARFAIGLHYWPSQHRPVVAPAPPSLGHECPKHRGWKIPAEERQACHQQSGRISGGNPAFPFQPARGQGCARLRNQDELYALRTGERNIYRPEIPPYSRARNAHPRLQQLLRPRQPLLPRLSPAPRRKRRPRCRHPRLLGSL